ncbi:protein of unknown function [Pseudomonas mediterranea]
MRCASLLSGLRVHVSSSPQHIQLGLDACGKGAADLLILLASGIRAQRRQRTACGPVIPMLAREVDTHELLQRGTGSELRGLRDAARRRFSHQVGLGAEVLVETSLGKSGGSHEIRDANAVIASLPKERGRGFNNMRAIRLRLFLRDFHRPSKRCPTCDQHTLMSFNIKMLTF